MKNTQQEETLNYFRKHASSWHEMAEESNQRKINVIQLRNNYVVDVINKLNCETFLDIGCGSGELACEVASKGIAASGVDFSMEMIDIAKNNAVTQNINNIMFDCCSIFDYNFQMQPYDVISANGFIEYISLEKLNNFLELVYNNLAPSGAFVVGSRNRLFNLFSLNSFTEQEITSNDIEYLMQEAIALNSDKAINDLLDFETVSYQKAENLRAKTKIDVATRFQYTPIQLSQLLAKNGFKTKQVYPVHIHAAAPSFYHQHSDVGGVLSYELQKHANNCSGLLPMASTFMIHAIKS